MGRGEENKRLLGKANGPLREQGGKRVGLRQYLFTCSADFSLVVRVNLPGCTTPGNGDL